MIRKLRYTFRKLVIEILNSKYHGTMHDYSKTKMLNSIIQSLKLITSSDSLENVQEFSHNLTKLAKKLDAVIIERSMKLMREGYASSYKASMSEELFGEFSYGLSDSSEVYEEFELICLDLLRINNIAFDTNYLNFGKDGIGYPSKQEIVRYISHSFFPVYIISILRTFGNVDLITLCLRATNDCYTIFIDATKHKEVHSEVYDLLNNSLSNIFAEIIKFISENNKLLNTEGNKEKFYSLTLEEASEIYRLIDTTIRSFLDLHNNLYTHKEKEQNINAASTSSSKEERELQIKNIIERSLVDRIIHNASSLVYTRSKDNGTTIGFHADLNGEEYLIKLPFRKSISLEKIVDLSQFLNEFIISGVAPIYIPGKTPKVIGLRGGYQEENDAQNKDKINEIIKHLKNDNKEEANKEGAESSQSTEQDHNDRVTKLLLGSTCLGSRMLKDAISIGDMAKEGTQPKTDNAFESVIVASYFLADYDFHTSNVCVQDSKISRIDYGFGSVMQFNNPQDLWMNFSNTVTNIYQYHKISPLSLPETIRAITTMLSIPDESVESIIGHRIYLLKKMGFDLLDSITAEYALNDRIHNPEKLRLSRIQFKRSTEANTNDPESSALLHLGRYYVSVLMRQKAAMQGFLEILKVIYKIDEPDNIRLSEEEITEFSQNNHFMLETSDLISAAYDLKTSYNPPLNKEKAIKKGLLHGVYDPYCKWQAKHGFIR